VHGSEAPSDWVVRCAPRVQRGPVLDVACGGGRHAVFFRDRGFEVVAVDRQPVALQGVQLVTADLEDGSPWPFAGERFGAIVVVNYLHRPLFPYLLGSLDEGGVLIYDTFMVGNERYGRPSNPAFLLKPGELLEAFRELEVVDFQEGEVSEPQPAVKQRLCARRSLAALRQGLESRP
jgi:SAM-dependent methyltransferase